jgi:hypothetical protein
MLFEERCLFELFERSPSGPTPASPNLFLVAASVQLIDLLDATLLSPLLGRLLGWLLRLEGLYGLGRLHSAQTRDVRVR